MVLFERGRKGARGAIYFPDEPKMVRAAMVLLHTMQPWMSLVACHGGTHWSYPGGLDGVIRDFRTLGGTAPFFASCHSACDAPCSVTCPGQRRGLQIARALGRPTWAIRGRFEELASTPLELFWLDLDSVVVRSSEWTTRVLHEGEALPGYGSGAMPLPVLCDVG